jgi:hypothetical protein
MPKIVIILVIKILRQGFHILNACTGILRGITRNVREIFNLAGKSVFLNNINLKLFTKNSKNCAIYFNIHLFTGNLSDVNNITLTLTLRYLK